MNPLKKINWKFYIFIWSYTLLLLLLNDSNFLGIKNWGMVTAACFTVLYLITEVLKIYLKNNRN
jgi:hypothetical protein